VYKDGNPSRNLEISFSTTARDENPETTGFRVAGPGISTVIDASAVNWGDDTWLEVPNFLPRKPGSYSWTVTAMAGPDEGGFVQAGPLVVSNPEVATTEQQIGELSGSRLNVTPSDYLSEPDGWTEPATNPVTGYVIRWRVGTAGWRSSPVAKKGSFKLPQFRSGQKVSIQVFGSSAFGVGKGISRHATIKSSSLPRLKFLRPTLTKLQCGGSRTEPPRFWLKGPQVFRLSIRWRAPKSKKWIFEKWGEHVDLKSSAKPGTYLIQTKIRGADVSDAPLGFDPKWSKSKRIKLTKAQLTRVTHSLPCGKA